jgi:hypothetical protein
MRLSDLLKATVICGGIAFVVYSVPLVSQAAVIGLLALLWASCAHQAIRRMLRQAVR